MKQSQFTPYVVIMEDPIVHTQEHPHCNDQTCPCQVCLMCEERHPLRLRHCTRCKRLVCLAHSRRMGFLVLCQECEAS